MSSSSPSASSIQQRIDALARDCITCDATGCGQTNPRHRCSRCQMVYYCGRDCQKHHWKEHKADCAAGLLIQQRFGLGQDITFNFNDNNNNHDDNNKNLDEMAPAVINDECPICLSSCLEKPVVLKACHHQFCFSCIKNWQQYQNSETATSACPLCRKQSTQDVQEEAMERARLLAGRAYQLERRSRKNKDNDNDALLSKQQQQAHECRDQAIEELDRVLEGDKLPHLQALVTKAEIYSQNNQHQQALELYDNIIELDNQRHEKATHLEQLLERYEQAVAMGQPVDETVEAQLDAAEEELTNGSLGTRIAGTGPARHTQFHLGRAQAYEHMNEWDQAKEVYQYLLQLDDFMMAGTPPQHRAAFMGLSRCAYHMGRYDKALLAAQAALEMNRHFPDVHKFIALSLKAQGKLEEAVQTMNRGALYEAPWEDDHREEVLKLYEELKAELDATTM